MPINRKNPRKKKSIKRKRKPLAFNQEYFDRNKQMFNPRFLAENPVKRSGMLAKYHRKLALTNNRLAKIHSWIKKQLEKAGELETRNQETREAFLSRIFRKKDEGTKIAKDLFKDAAGIFSEEYGEAITSSAYAHTPDQTRIHECHQFLHKNENMYRAIRQAVFD